MRMPVFLMLPPALLLALTLTLAIHPGASEWPAQTLFLCMPYILLGIAFLLGLFFIQSRVSFTALVGAASIFLIHSAFFVELDPARGDAVILASAIAVPLVAGLSYWLNERGLFTSYGLVRSLIVLVVLLFLCFLPASAGFRQAAVSSGSPAFRSASGWIRIPGLGILALLAGACSLLIKRKGESPLLGALLAFALLFFFGGLNFQSSAWRPDRGHAAFVLFMSGAAFTLSWAVLESAWRHAHIDELTELPGRRSLRHHFRCLGSSYAIAVLDLDHFKSVNDTYGHLVGDQVLRFVARQIARESAGTPYRYGGEEFVIVYEHAAFDDVLADLEDLRTSVAEREFHLRGEDRPARKPKKPGSQGARRSPRTIRLTVSIGVATSSRKHAGPQETLEAADTALYRAKEDGRNQVCKAR